MKISLKTGCETPKTVLAECTLKKKNGRLKMLAAFLYLIYSGGKKNS